MARTREIKKRITAVRTIQRITKTMQMIATAKFTHALARAKATRPFTQKVQQLVAEVAAAAGDLEHPLINGPAEPARRELLLVISSDRGLCGAYNGNVLRQAIHHVRSLRSGGVELELQTSGKKAVGFFRFQKTPIAQRHTFGDKVSYEQVERLAESFIAAFMQGKIDAVRVASMKFISNTRQSPQLLQLLPLKPPAAAPATGSTSAAPKQAAGLYEFSPSAAELLDDLLPLTVKTMLFQAFNDAVVSEQIMRMVAMKAATENAKELGKLLRRRYNRARQTQITTELMEVIGGAAAQG
jgi:F-type H+-transporting ATPase subunit gamma